MRGEEREMRDEEKETRDEEKETRDETRRDAIPLPSLLRCHGSWRGVGGKVHIMFEF